MLRTKPGQQRATSSQKHHNKQSNSPSTTTKRTIRTKKTITKKTQRQLLSQTHPLDILSQSTSLAPDDTTILSPLPQQQQQRRSILTSATTTRSKIHTLPTTLQQQNTNLNPHGDGIDDLDGSNMINSHSNTTTLKVNSKTNLQKNPNHIITTSKRFMAKPTVLDLERNAQLSSDDSHPDEEYALGVDTKRAAIAPQSFYQISRSKLSIARYNPHFNANVDNSYWDYQSYRPNYGPIDTYLAGEKLGQGMFSFVHILVVFCAIFVVFYVYFASCFFNFFFKLFTPLVIFSDFFPSQLSSPKYNNPHFNSSIS